jgi:hypothetical protein
LGQRASGKSTAAGTLIKYPGGEGEVALINDQEHLAGLGDLRRQVFMAKDR